jgi:hypothetical protein
LVQILATNKTSAGFQNMGGAYGATTTLYRDGGKAASQAIDINTESA